MIVTDNDVFVSGTRTNSFGDFRSGLRRQRRGRFLRGVPGGADPAGALGALAVVAHGDPLTLAGYRMSPDLGERRLAADVETLSASGPETPSRSCDPSIRDSASPGDQPGPGLRAAGQPGATDRLGVRSLPRNRTASSGESTPPIPARPEEHLPACRRGAKSPGKCDPWASERGRDLSRPGPPGRRRGPGGASWLGPPPRLYQSPAG